MSQEELGTIDGKSEIAAWRAAGRTRTELVGAEVGFDHQGQGGLDGQAGGDQGLDPVTVEAVGVIFDLGEEVIEGFEVPAALEIFSIQALAKLLDESLCYFIVYLVAHLLALSIYLIPLLGSRMRGSALFTFS